MKIKVQGQGRKLSTDLRKDGRCGAFATFDKFSKFASLKKKVGLYVVIYCSKKIVNNSKFVSSFVREVVRGCIGLVVIATNSCQRLNRNESDVTGDRYQLNENVFSVRTYGELSSGILFFYSTRQLLLFILCRKDKFGYVFVKEKKN